MKYRISIIGKIKSNDEDLITRKYLKRIKNIELKQYEVKTKNKEKKLAEEAKKLINWHPKTNLHEGIKKFIEWYKTEYDV